MMPSAAAASAESAASERCADADDATSLPRCFIYAMSRRCADALCRDYDATTFIYEPRADAATSRRHAADDAEPSRAIRHYAADERHYAIIIIRAAEPPPDAERCAAAATSRRAAKMRMMLIRSVMPRLMPDALPPPRRRRAMPTRG